MFDNYFFSDDFEILSESINIYHNPYKFISSPNVISTPIIFITYLIGLKIFGINPIGYQITNLIIHMANILLLGIFISILFN